MSNETIKNYGKSIRSKLLNISKKEDVFHQTILTRFFQERLLYRMSRTRYRDNFYLKGGALMYAYEKFAARPTLDIDFLGNNISNVFNNDLLSEITNLHKIDTVVTHSAPSFCEIQNKDGLLQWAIYDNSLLDDVQKERETMDAIYTKLRAVPEPLTHWYYGHFHQSWRSSIDGVLFKMLDIMELAEITH